LRAADPDHLGPDIQSAVAVLLTLLGSFANDPYSLRKVFASAPNSSSVLNTCVLALM
jgi:hypothetical protein